MVDAAIGGKNGVNIGLNKNAVGTFTQPDFIFYCTPLLATLPTTEWRNGFAEIIKYACILSRDLFSKLENNTLEQYQMEPELLTELVLTCAKWKYATVVADEHDHGRRKLLNFGHTVGHAIETLHHLPHGYAVAIGMVIASKISVQLGMLHEDQYDRISRLLVQYELPISQEFDTTHVIALLRNDKKRTGDTIDYVVLHDLGVGGLYPMPLLELEKILHQ